ncbi:septum formation family protein [Micromonospora sp. PLK6-60]|uniref:septum formation family protein n=1 Tax=Micromonospora sp. PLK6-60 TaxID=2873383 RepID=UPI001CA65DE2|nr:septum formation family protein [Micromonospora sp. PLK6-60]MBY8871346.1 septum formation family protein [Micromonospora sp. PLK6-60]
MARRLFTSLGLLLPALLAGCGATDNGGGTVAASPTPTAETFVPQAGVCHPEAETVGYRATYTTVDCASTHRTETIHVGAFTGPAADRVTPPPARSPEMRAAFRDCDRKTSTFVGADWRGARMSIRVVAPAPQDWTAGSRWYRCDLYALPTLDGSTAKKHPDDLAAQRDGTLRAELTRPSPLAHTCFTEDEYELLQPAACTKPHRFEYVGIWTAPDVSYQALDGFATRIHDSCRSVIRRHTRGTPDEKLAAGAGTTYRLPSPEAWERGDRGVRCFYWSDDHDLTRPLKKSKPAG